MACGTPVVAYARGSVPEVIDEGRTGFVVDSVPEAVRAVQNVDRLDRRACRRRFEERFTSRRMAEDYVGVYRELRGPARPKRGARMRAQTAAE